jgi:hypothetical protein
VFRLTGNPEHPIILRQHPGERAVIDGATGSDPTFAVDGSDTWYWGFELTNSNLDRASKNASRRILRAQGFNIHAPRTKFINLVAHDTAIGFGFWSEAPDAEMYG